MVRHKKPKKVINLNKLYRKKKRSSNHHYTQLIDVHFTNVQSCILSLLRTVNKLDIATCWLTNKSLISALQKPDMQTRIITCKSALNKNIDFLNTIKIGVNKNSLMHHKFAIGYNTSNQAIWVITGSYNWTENSRNNLENIVVIRQLDIISAYVSEFESLWLQPENREKKTS